MQKVLHERHQGALPSNTEPNPREQVNSITTRSGLTSAEPFIPPPVPPTPGEELKKELETLMDEVTDTQKLLSAVPLPDDPYVAVRQTQLVDTDTESDPEEAPSEVEELQSVGSRDCTYGRAYSADLSPGKSARIAETTALSPSSFCKRYRSSYETSSSSSLNLPGRKRYRGTTELILDIDSEGDELGEEDTEEDASLDADDEREKASSLEEEEADQAVLVVETAVSESLRLGYGALRRHKLAVEEDQPTLVTWVDPEDDRVYTDVPAYVPPAAPVQTPPSPEWSLSSLPVSPSSPVVTSPTASPVATPTATILRLDVLPPTLVENIDRDVRELYARSGVVRDEIFSSVLALEAWARHVDTRLAGTSWDRYDDHRLIHDMLVQQAAMQRELQEMRGRVATLEQEVRRVVCKWRDLPRKMEPKALNQVRFAWESLNECCYQYEQVRSAIHVEILTIVNTCGMSLVLHERPQGALPSNTESNPREQVNLITTRSGLTTAEPFIPPRVPPTPGEELKKEPETLMDEVHITSPTSTAHVPPPGIQPVSL
ncbi:hypothetical protein Tco_0569905 [Tanacetum coccineum]